MKFYGPYDAKKFVTIDRPHYDASVKDRSVAECIKKMREDDRKRERELRPLWVKTTVKFVVTSFVTYVALAFYVLTTLFLAHFALYENRVEMLENGEFILKQSISPIAIVAIIAITLAMIAFLYGWVLENADEARRYLASKGLKWLF